MYHQIPQKRSHMQKEHLMMVSLESDKSLMRYYCLRFRKNKQLVEHYLKK